MMTDIKEVYLRWVLGSENKSGEKGILGMLAWAAAQKRELKGSFGKEFSVART